MSFRILDTSQPLQKVPQLRSRAFRIIMVNIELICVIPGNFTDKTRKFHLLDKIMKIKQASFVYIVYNAPKRLREISTLFDVYLVIFIFFRVDTLNKSAFKSIDLETKRVLIG